MKSVLKLGTTLCLFFVLLASCQKETLTEELSLQENTSTLDLADEADEVAVLEKSYFGKAIGGVYVMDNDPAGNHVLAFSRRPNGSLSGPIAYATGGAGSGAGLGSQGSIITNGPFVFVVNAGSNEISVFFAIGSRLRLLDKVDSKGILPTSLALHGRTLYVLNAGGEGNIAGFRLDRRARLTYIEGSNQSLSSSSAAAAQISFNHTGNALVVTERATNLITTFEVDYNGVASPGTSFPSAGVTPFGFEFSKSGQFIVSEAAGGAAGASTMSSYRLGNNANVSLLEGPVATNQTAACWVVVTGNGRYAYTTNTGSNSVSGFRVGNNGELDLLNEDGATGLTGAGPIDMDLSQNSKFLYTINNGDDSISIFAVQASGNLTHIGEVRGLPATSLGLAAQ